MLTKPRVRATWRSGLFFWGGGVDTGKCIKGAEYHHRDLSLLYHILHQRNPSTTRLSILAGSSECPHVPVRRSSKRAYLGLGRFPGWRRLRDARLVTRAADGTNRELTLVLPDNPYDSLVGIVTLDHSREYSHPHHIQTKVLDSWLLTALPLLLAMAEWRNGQLTRMTLKSPRGVRTIRPPLS